MELRHKNIGLEYDASLYKKQAEVCFESLKSAADKMDKMNELIRD